jgi:Tfp pilus assembly protein PilX
MLVSSAISTLRRRLRPLAGEEGISMIIAIGILLVTSMLLVAAFTSAQGEIKLTTLDTNAKKAYYAAQAGINDYLYHLTRDSNYLSYCTSPTPENPALNQEGPITTKATIPGSEKEATPEKYAIQLLPAASAPEGDKKCDVNNLSSTMIEQTGAAAGTFRIESIGYSGNEKRAIVATFKNVNFVSYVWFTKYETFDPIVYGEPIKLQCGAFWPKRPEGSGECRRTNFMVTGESINGPIHTEDQARICGEPYLGRNATDRIEFGSRGEPAGEGYSNEGCGGEPANPHWVGTHIPVKEVPELEPPPGDEELQHIEGRAEYEKKTEIVLKGNTMNVTRGGVTVTNVPFPKGHLIYVSGGCALPAYSPFGPTPGYTEDAACGNVYVSGEYSESLTIAAMNDVVINGNLIGPHNSEGTPTGTVMLGLIANNFVRIYHPLTGTRGSSWENCGSAENNLSPGKDLKEPVIDAAILALKHSIIVDNLDCGAANLGRLNINGAVASLFSNGATGIFGSGAKVVNGYPYNLKYDSRLLAEEPPHFLNPIRAAWVIQHVTLATKP